MKAMTIGRAAAGRTQWIGAAAGAALGAAVVPVLIRWGQHRWLIGTGHGIAAAVVLTWTLAGFLVGGAARRLSAHRGEAAMMAVCGLGAGTLTIWLLMAVFPLRNYEGGDSSAPVVEEAEAIVGAAALVSLLVLLASAALARLLRRSRRPSRALIRSTAALAVALVASLPVAVTSAWEETQARKTFEVAGGDIWTTTFMVDQTLRPALVDAEPLSGSVPGVDLLAAYTARGGHAVTFEPHASTRTTGLTARHDTEPGWIPDWAEPSITPGGVYSLPAGPEGGILLDSVTFPGGAVFAALCSEGAERKIAGLLGYADTPWGPGFCDGTVHLFTAGPVDSGGGQARVTVLGSFAEGLFCAEPDPASTRPSASWVSTPSSVPCLSKLSDGWRRYAAAQADLSDATRQAADLRNAVVVLILLLAVAAAPSVAALRGRLGVPGRGPGPGPGGRTARPATLDLGQGWAVGLLAAAAEALDDADLAERFLEEWRADVAQFRRPWRRLLYALGVRLLAPRRLRRAQRMRAPDPPARG